MYSETLLLTISSVLISVGGTFTNALSLSFFIKQDDRTLATKLFMLLNSLDLVVCVFGAMSVVSNFDIIRFQYQVYLQIILVALYGICLVSTAYATCLLSVTRAICLCKPFYKVNKKAINISTVSFIVFLTVTEILYRVYRNYNEFGITHSRIKLKASIMMIELSLSILVVMGSNILSVAKLMRNKDETGEHGITEVNKKATITVFILSVLFCSFNLIFLMPLITYTATGNLVESFQLFFAFIDYLAIPLNSALNPVVYFCRKQVMRDYVKELLQKLSNFISSLRGSLENSEQED